MLVPKTHPLFNLEGDDPLCIPERLERIWVAKAYSGKPKNNDSHSPNPDLGNPIARLLLLRTSVKDKKWEQWRPWWQDLEIGSILVVARQGGHVEVGEVRALCDFIREKMSPLMTEERALTLGGQQEVLATISEENLVAFVNI